MSHGLSDIMGSGARRLGLLASCAALLLPAARAREPIVTITGGVDETQNYKWTVTNHHSSPIVYIQFPHFHADMFQTPVGWNQKCTYLVNVGVPDVPGTCTASVDAPRKGIQTGRSAQFDMRISTGGAQRRPGKVTVRFADGSATIVSGVELPTRSSTSERLVALVGLGLVFGILLLTRWRRRRKKPAPAPVPDVE